MLSFRTTETPEYRFVMQLHKNQTLSSITRVLEEIHIPTWNLILVQHNIRSNAVKVLYNTTVKVCDFWHYMKRIRIFNIVAENLFKQEGRSNMSLKCPLKVGTYFMRDIMVPPDTAILKFMYVPQTTYTLFGNVYAQLPNKRMILKCSYEINGTVLKSC